MANNIYHYYVEGDDEKKVIDTLKTSMQLIISGKVDVFNVIERKFTRNQIMRLKQGTIVVLVFDTDTNQVDTLLEQHKNLSNALKTHGFNIEKFWCKDPSYPFDTIKNESLSIKK